MKHMQQDSIICFGDSITWYDGHPYNWGKEAGKTAVGFESYLRDSGFYVKNEGISDATIIEISRHLKETDIGRFSCVLLTAGANDSRYNIPTGVLSEPPYDLSTFIGCLQSCIDYIRKNSGAATILATPVKGWIYAPAGYAYAREEDGEVEERFAAAIRKVAAFYNLRVCDWYNESGIEKATMSTMINDPDPDKSAEVNPNPFYSLHPSSAGYKRMGELLLKTLRQL